MTKSEEFFKMSLNKMPGGVNSPVRAFNAVKKTPFFVERAQGAYIYDVDGEKIIKFIGCYHGHSDGLLMKAGSGVLTEAIPDSAGIPKDYAKFTLLANYNDENSVKKNYGTIWR
mgnify:CR=1 FL=1